MQSSDKIDALKYKCLIDYKKKMAASVPFIE